MTQTIRGYSPASDIQSARSHYLSEGFVQGPKLVSDGDLERYNAAFDAVMRGEWETGKPPRDEWWDDSDETIGCPLSAAPYESKQPNFKELAKNWDDLVGKETGMPLSHM